jgi:hypothetical protein
LYLADNDRFSVRGVLGSPKASRVLPADNVKLLGSGEKAQKCFPVAQDAVAQVVRKVAVDNDPFQTSRYRQLSIQPRPAFIVFWVQPSEHHCLHLMLKKLMKKPG